MAKKRSTHDKPSEQIRRAILESRLTRYAIAKAAGVEQSVLTRFVSGQRGFTLETLDRLAPVLGIKITVEPPGPRTDED